MIDARALRSQLGEVLRRSALPGLPAPRADRGRDVYEVPGRAARLLVYTDRTPAGDDAAPFRGELAAGLAASALRACAGVCPHALLDRPDPCALLLRALRPCPVRLRVEGAPGRVVVRAAPADDPAFELDEARARDLAGAALWEELRVLAISLFEHGARRFAAAGLELLEAQLDFGLDARGAALLADEALTPDTTRLRRGGTELARGGSARFGLFATRRRLAHARALLALATAIEGAEPELHPGPALPRLARGLKRAGLVEG